MDPLELKIERTDDGFKAVLPQSILPDPHPSFQYELYRLNRDPPKVIRLFAYEPERLVTSREALANHLSGGGEVFMQHVYRKVGELWLVIEENGVATVPPKGIKPETVLYEALDIMLNATQKITPKP